ncbi:deoxyribodipyrimidine photo-lyase [bacterium]|nr:MAG: deoxyribodipyrimidine photo-lyase [bacterium]QQR62143.1 MAG: deoxyribodipyrimidine photo-lyase [bacterium]QQR63300.1 MAG: deoxyribodipyrimidine photo-lyase [bacterium]
MIKKYKLSLFIFRRDLRLTDNTALIKACNKSDFVMPIFCFDQRQVVPKNNPFFSEHAAQFMLESLKDLTDEIKAKKGRLYFFVGTIEAILSSIIPRLPIEAVFFNKDYTPFSLQRDHAIAQLCIENNVACHAYDDVTLCSVQTLKNKQQKPYTVFTHFFNAAIRTSVIDLPVAMPFKMNWYIKSIEDSYEYHKVIDFYQLNKIKKPDTGILGGFKHAEKIVSDLLAFLHYDKTKDVPSLSTTKLSPHIKFGTISIRQVYHAIVAQLEKTHPLMRQLYWHDFFIYTSFYRQDMFGSCLRSEYNGLSWSENQDHWDAWKDGKTGFPIIDAGMRELNQTGFMHNRIRMMVASFLVKDLHINWQWGERYFAQKLVDYDPAVNNGNWQWCASVGVDAQPYFRIFNPWLGQKKYDPDCVYIKQWIPELRKYDSQIIHTWYNNKVESNKNYPKPIIDHKIERVKALTQYKHMK